MIRQLEGRDAVCHAIANSSRSRDGVDEYVLEMKLDDRTTLSCWRGTIDGHKLESLELLLEGRHLGLLQLMSQLGNSTR